MYPKNFARKSCENPCDKNPSNLLSISLVPSGSNRRSHPVDNGAITEEDKPDSDWNGKTVYSHCESNFLDSCVLDLLSHGFGGICPLFGDFW